MSKVPVQFRLNGEDRAEFTDGGATLLQLLRGKVGDHSVKGGCHQGTCGTCSVIVDGELRLSCITLAEMCLDSEIETVAGLGRLGDDLHPLQQAFLDHFATQCGFCTPGMIMAGKALLDRNPNPTRDDVVDAIAGNICRCTGYEPIIQAILAAAAASRACSEVTS
jgi:aerobic carbon-monoxide dehydrogenase small subunit